MHPGASEVWCALGELRERKLERRPPSALDAYNEALNLSARTTTTRFQGAIRAAQAVRPPTCCP
jgi:hypothetical protein